MTKNELAIGGILVTPPITHPEFAAYHGLPADTLFDAFPDGSGYISWGPPSPDDSLPNSLFDQRLVGTGDEPAQVSLEERLKRSEDEKKKRPRPTAPNPAPPEGIPDDNEAIAVCTAPDVCKTPCGSSTPAIPYQVYGLAGDDGNYSPDVFYNGCRAMRFDSVITRTLGDEPGVAKGVKSGTVGDIVEPTSHSTVVHINGKPAIRHRDNCTLNKGNCPGEFVFVKKTDIQKAPDGNNKSEETGNGQPSGDQRGFGERFGDGFSENASETWEGMKTVGSNAWDGTKELASAVWHDPLGSAASGAANIASAAASLARWYGTVTVNMLTDPFATMGRGVDNALATGAAIWHGVADPYAEAYAKGGLAQALGHGTFDVVKLTAEAIATKGAVTAAGKVASTGAVVAKAANKADDAADAAKNAKRLDGDTENGKDGVRVTGRPFKVRCFDMPPGLDPKEYDRQLAEQMKTINKMTADDMAYAHWVLEKAGGTKALRQPQAQVGHRIEYAEMLELNGMSKADIQKHMKGLHATHFLDMIAGGDPTVFSRDAAGNPVLGDGKVNSDIGFRWTQKGRASSLRAEAERMRREGRASEKMKVELERCK